MRRTHAALRRRFVPVRGPFLPSRIARLVAGLVVFGAGDGLLVQSGLGVPPWDVLHQGLEIQLGGTIGLWSVIVAFAVLVVWIPLAERYGLGTVLNAVLIGVTLDATVAVVPPADGGMRAWLLLAGGILTVAAGSGLYIGAGLGPGPRDGLMTAIARRGPSLRLTRTLIEGAVLLSGWALGGTFGAGTVAFALLIGPLVQVFLGRLTVRTAP